jgi:hypothetical protein
MICPICKKEQGEERFLRSHLRVTHVIPDEAVSSVIERGKCQHSFGDRCDIAGELCVEIRGDECPVDTRCPHVVGKQGGDESLNFCNINDKLCLLETNNECPEWEDIQREWRREHRKEEEEVDHASMPTLRVE